MRACAQVVQLRRELAASEDYERLSARAAELRRGLSEAPIVATSDPLPAAFNATLGRFVPIGGTEGVALLLTVVVELMSSFGLVGLSKLHHERQRSGRPTKGSLVVGLDKVGEGEGAQPRATQQSIPLAEVVTLPHPSLNTAASGRSSPRKHSRREASGVPSNVLPMTPRSPPRALSEGASPRRQCGRSGALPETQSHVPAFIQQRLHSAKGTSVAAKELRAVYEASVSPACAGMVRYPHALISHYLYLPRTRGDGPDKGQVKKLSGGVSPARAGDGHHPSPGPRRACRCLPRRRGDGPTLIVQIGGKLVFPPHPQGWRPVIADARTSSLVPAGGR